MKHDIKIHQRHRDTWQLRFFSDLHTAQDIAAFRPAFVASPRPSTTALAGALGVQDILVKDESHRFGLNAFKVLAAAMPSAVWWLISWVRI